MKLPSGVMGNHPVEAWERDDVSRNASEPDSASLGVLEGGQSFPEDEA